MSSLVAESADILVTDGGFRIERRVRQADPDDLRNLSARLDSRLGGVFTSGVEYPGRYTRWELGYENPLLTVAARGPELVVTSPGPRGEVLLAGLVELLADAPELVVRREARELRLAPADVPAGVFSEEERSRRPSAFTSLRAVLAALRTPDDSHLGFYGAFAYDLLFQFEPIELKLPRPDDHRDFLLHLPDRLLVHDRATASYLWLEYEFAWNGSSTADLERTVVPAPIGPAAEVPADLPPGDYAAMVDVAKEYFRRGDLYEVVPSQPLHVRCSSPAQMFERLQETNPAPYSFLINLGTSHLVGASPEMYVRVTGRTVETCPISGTRPRGKDALGDAQQILELLNSAKDEAELTMCTDVDRNDKARVCVPGSVKVIGRRQIELYSRLIHTVDHVVGTLREDRDALDAFLTHMWAVTVTGAPKKWATQFIEDHEDSARGWYGGAVGGLLLNGDINTGLTLRTAQIKDQVALVRAGATLLYDSVPVEEEAETRLKAGALLAVASGTAAPAQVAAVASVPAPARPGRLRVLVVDHEDSFTLNLASYFREAGCDVVTVRAGSQGPLLAQDRWDLVVLSPGPGRPSTFAMADLIGELYEAGIPMFGVCLGLQGLVEQAGGRLHQLPEPVHGKASRILGQEGVLFGEQPVAVAVARYHSLYALADEVPAQLRVTAQTADGIVMAVEHRDAPAWAVQFHPESILSAAEGGGLEVIRRVVEAVELRRAEAR